MQRENAAHQLGTLHGRIQGLEEGAQLLLAEAAALRKADGSRGLLARARAAVKGPLVEALATRLEARAQALTAKAAELRTQHARASEHYAQGFEQAKPKRWWQV